MNEPVVTVERLSKRYRLGTSPDVPGLWHRLWRRKRPDTPPARPELWALKDVSFSVAHGERIGIIGRNGAGKSTLLKILSRVVYPTSGEARIRGRLTSLLEVGTGFNDNLTGQENIYLNAALHGLTRAEVNERLDDIIAFSEVARFIDTPVKNYSSGMRMRLAFSVAAHLEPDILLMDEVLAVGDMSFQRKCLERVSDLASGGRTLFFVSHSMDAVVRYCDRCLWVDQGQIRMDGPVEEVSAAYVETVMAVTSSYRKPPNKPAAPAERPATSDTPPPIPAPAAAPPVQPPVTIGIPAAYGDEPQGFLVHAHVVGPDGQPRLLHRVSEVVGVEMVYDVAVPGLFVPGVQLVCPQGTLAFVSVPPVTEPEQYHARPGRYRARVWIPQHLLNIGTYSVTLSLFSPDVNPFKRHFKMERLLSFQTVEAEAGVLSAQGCLPRPMPGAVRPKLEWDVTPLDNAGTVPLPTVGAA